MEFTPPIKNLRTHIAVLAKKYPARAALLACDEEGGIVKTISYKDVELFTERIASALASLGVRSGGVVALALPNCVELILISWAAWAAGIITVPLDVRRDTAKEYAYKMKLTGATLLVLKKDLVPKAEQGHLANIAKIIDADEFFHTRARNAPPVVWAKDLLHTALFLFTSGTTALPKGAELTLCNLVANADGIVDWLNIKQTDRFCALLPLYHINSTTFCLSSLLAGAGIAVPPQYSNSRFWQQLAKTRSTFTSIVPTICYDQLSRQKEYVLVKTKLRVSRIQIGSSPVVASDVLEFMKLYDIPLFQGYGQTETALRVTGVPMGLEQKTYAKLVRDNSVGAAMKWAEVVVMDKQGNILKEKQEGQIVSRGPVVMKGYLKNDTANNEAFLNGYFLTGDIGYWKTMQKTKFFFLKGRAKEIIIKGGVNLSPVAIEDKLKRINRHIDQVFVVGVPDRRYGEEPGAVICWKKTGKSQRDLETALKNQLLGAPKYLAPVERPQYIATIDATALPVTSTGKVQRSVLKTSILASAFQSIHEISRSGGHRFLRLNENQKSFMAQALQLVNYCWSPLVTEASDFLNQVRHGTVIIAVDAKDVVRGALVLLRVSLRKNELRRMTYSQVMKKFAPGRSNAKPNAVVCVSICVSSYKRPDGISKKIVADPGAERMLAYLRSGKDMVYNFHQKPKGGMSRGAELLAALPGSRPEDQMSLGYNLLLRYPPVSRKTSIDINADASLAVQLIECAFLVAQQAGIQDVFAFSRPAGAYEFFKQP
ncbi:MAG: acyl--CoA ligase [Candidatus Wildermuthbacteria bacterium]|nr:acyl--CoA ligase [Candidatus Wildermuthbacteria bacterium]